mgnify:CR=1 FL=1|jgi:uncharacterized membrane protein YoaT (DUF817 family)
MRFRMRTFLYEFWLFGIKLASSSIFGGYLLFLIVVTHFWYPIEGLYRNDFLFLAAVGFQVVLLAFRLESTREAAVIMIFHVVATFMELFKTSDAINAWHYPGEAIVRLGNVPLFAGFMYSAVGSYMVRVVRILDFRFTHAPPTWASFVLATLIYANFFTHHFFIDIRNVLLVGSVVLYGRCIIYFRMDKVHRHMPLMLAQFLTAIIIWFAENVATYSRIWIYPNQTGEWQMVPFNKLVAWYLLLSLSFVLVTIVHPLKPMIEEAKRKDKQC